jgi:hypothetical protein
LTFAYYGTAPVKTVDDMSKRSREIITLDDDGDKIIFVGSKKYVDSGNLSRNNGSNNISGGNSGNSSSSRIGYVACPICNQSLPDGMINVYLDSCLGQKRTMIGNDLTIEDKILSCKEHILLQGVWIIHDFITEVEEIEIINELGNDETPWGQEMCGNYLSKRWGVKRTRERTVRVNNPSRGEYDMPAYLLPYIDRLKSYKMPSVLSIFRPNECNANSYMKAEKHDLAAHCDDRFLFGPVLMNLSLAGRCFMTISKGDSEVGFVRIDLPKRCLQLVTGKARYDYKNRINECYILDAKRISITFRQAGYPYGGLIKGQACGTPSILDYMHSNNSDANV